MGSIKDLTTEELLARVVGSSTLANLPAICESVQVINFIKDLPVISGDSRIPVFLIYYTYCRIWKTTRKKLTKIDFFRKFNKFFIAKRSKSVRYYMIKPGIFTRDKDIIDNAKKFDKKYEKKIRQKRELKRKIKGPVSSTKPKV